MNKKSFIAFCAVLVIGVVGVFVAKTHAITVNGPVLTGSTVLNLIDLSDEPLQDESITLPQITGSIDGKLRIYKVTGNDSYTATIYPFGSDKIDNGRVTDGITLFPKSAYVLLLADNANSTWWVIGQGVYQ